MFRLLFTIICFSLIFPLSVNEEFATRVASNLLIERGDRLGFEINSVDLISDDSNDLFYIFNLAPKGFILVAADDRVLPILGYGFEDNFIYSDNMPTNIQYLLDLFKEEIKISILENIIPTDYINNEWNKYTSTNITKYCNIY